MNATRKLVMGALVACALAFPQSVLAGDEQATASAGAAEAPAFSSAQIEQLVAPIALYPDALLAQVLMASTYPLEIVEASRWVKKNPGLEDDALDAALKDQDWDPSVKSLCALPDVLNRMNENLDWTQDLGDAFLAQQDDVMRSVQTMRAKAYEAGNLETTEQQKVVVEQQQGEKIIVIQQASPQVVYVPTYSPAVVYGPAWSYPAPYYPAMYAPPGYGLLAFGAGMAVGAAIWGDCHWGYGHGHGYGNVNVNINRYNQFNRNTNVRWNDRGNVGNGGRWQHNPEHRGGVNYRNKATARQYGASTGSNRVTRDQARGYSGGQRPGAQRPGAAPSTRDMGGRGGGVQRPGAAPSTRDVGGRGGSAQRPGAPSTRDVGGRGGSAQRPGAAPSTREAGGRGGAAQRPSAAPSPSVSGSRGGAGASAQRPSATPSPRSSGSRGGAWSGAGNGGFDRASSQRGAASRGSSGGYSRGGGGGVSRGGGGGFSRGGGARGGRR